MTWLFFDQFNPILDPIHPILPYCKSLIYKALIEDRIILSFLRDRMKIG